MKNNNNNIKLLLALLTILIITLVSFFLWSNKEKEVRPLEDVVLTYKGKNYTYNRDLEFLLITGLDSYEQYETNSYMNNQLCDFLVLLAIDDTTKEITPIHINRDSMVNYNVLGVKGEIVSSDFGQIALSHTYGDGGLKSLVNVKDAVSDLLCNIHIDYYVSLTMDSIGIINDLLGHVEVYMDDDYTSINSKFVKGNNVTLIGDEALSFVRNRYDAIDSSNLSRMNRQKEFMKKLYLRIQETEISSTKVLDGVAQYIVSNANISDLASLSDKFKNYKLNDFVNIDGEVVVNKNVEYYLDEDSLKDVATKVLREIE